MYRTPNKTSTTQNYSFPICIFKKTEKVCSLTIHHSYDVTVSDVRLSDDVVRRRQSTVLRTTARIKQKKTVVVVVVVVFGQLRVGSNAPECFVRQQRRATETKKKITTKMKQNKTTSEVRIRVIELSDRPSFVVDRTLELQTTTTTTTNRFRRTKQASHNLCFGCRCRINSESFFLTSLYERYYSKLQSRQSKSNKTNNLSIHDHSRTTTGMRRSMMFISAITDLSAVNSASADTGSLSGFCRMADR
jgi:hypothetical protein